MNNPEPKAFTTVIRAYAMCQQLEELFRVYGLGLYVGEMLVSCRCVILFLSIPCLLALQHLVLGVHLEACPAGPDHVDASHANTSHFTCW